MGKRKYIALAPAAVVIALLALAGIRAPAKDDAQAAPLAGMQIPATTHRTPAAIERTLYEVEARARDKRALTPADVREGALAIAELSPFRTRQQIEARSREFGRRMALVARQVTVAPRIAELDELRALVSKERDDEARLRLVAQFQRRADELPAIERDAAIAELQRALEGVTSSASGAR